MKRQNESFARIHWVLFSALMVCGACAHAGAVYRCKGPNQEIAITNKPGGYSSCIKLANSDYADPAPTVIRPDASSMARASKATLPAPGTQRVTFFKPGDAGSVEASQTDLSARAPTGVPDKTAPLANTMPPARNAYLSAPASAFANTVGGARVDGIEQKVAVAENSTEKVDKSVEVRRGAMYKVAHASGITEYTNVRPAAGAYQLLFTYIATCYACNVHSAINFATVALNLDAYRAEVATAAAEFGLDPAFLRAIIHAESAFNPNAISDKGAQGLMQLMPGTASDMGVASPFDGPANIRGGAHYLALLMRQFNGDERLAAAAYNAGAQNVQKYSGIPPFDETRFYVERVATLRKRYGEFKNQ